MAKRSLGTDIAIIAGAAGLGIGLVYLLTKGAKAKTCDPGDVQAIDCYGRPLQQTCDLDGTWLPICQPTIIIDTQLDLTTSPSVYVQDTNYIYGGLTTMTGTPVAGKTIVLFVNDTQVDSKVTDSNGQVRFDIIPTSAGTYSVEGSFAGDANYKPSSGSTSFTAEPRPPTEGPLQAIGKQIYDGATLVRLNGVNDSTVLAWQMGDILGQYPEYRYSNHNLPVYPVPGSTNSDRDCKIPSNSWVEFWYKYFWLLKNKLGGYTSAAPPYGYRPDVTGNTYLNHLRVGGHDGWGRDLQYKAFVQQRAICDQAMLNMLDMADANGIYVNITMGGTPPEDSLFGSGDLFTVDSNAYTNYVQYCADYINAYGNHHAIACFNLFNEPINHDSGNAYPDKKPRSPWWVARYNPNWATLGFPLVQDPALSQPYEAWENAAIKWKATLIADVKSLVTLNPRPLITIGGGNYSIVYTASDATQTYQRNRAHDYSMNDDLVVGHPYWGAEDDYIIQWWTRGDIEKPGYTEEWGYNQTSTGPPWYSWWPWTDLTLQKYGFSNCVMVLRDMPNPTPSGDPYVLPKPPYPGYPLDANDLAEATAAWLAYNG